MANALVIVESPAKAKTIEKYLGPGFKVMASVGHVVDLPSKGLCVDVEQDFALTYEVTKPDVVKSLREALKGASTLYLATDEDREGEAIAWHLSMELGAPGGDDRVQRVLFNEITKNAILAAIDHPGQLDRRKYDSQQARRILDRLVGYQISPILWKKVRRGLSAGRVQSVAVRLVVDREREILAFVPVEYWTVDADLAAALPPEFRARLAKVDGRKAEIADGATASALVSEVEKARFTVASVDRKERRRNPPPPFTTAKLQQEAANRLGFSAKKTMTLAQRLYEGVDIEGQPPLPVRMTGVLRHESDEEESADQDAQQAPCGPDRCAGPVGGGRGHAYGRSSDSSLGASVASREFLVYPSRAPGWT